MKILVTGATSALGAKTARLLLAAGHQVTVFQRSASGLDCAEVNADIGNRAAVRAAAAGHDQIVHLAAKVAPTGRRKDFDRVNISGTRNVIDAARAGAVGSIVHVSTPAVAHTSEPRIGAGTSPARPDQARGDYAITKAVAEQIALDASDGSLAVVSIRPHLVWGPGDTQLIGRIIERTRAGRFAFVGSGLALIDTTYLDNAADALIAAATAVADRADAVAGQPFVVSNAEPRTVLEIVSRVVEAAGLTVSTRHVPRAIAMGAGTIFERAWNAANRSDDPPMTGFVAEGFDRLRESFRGSTPSSRDADPQQQRWLPDPSGRLT